MRPAPAADALLLPHMHVDRRVCAACSFEPAVALAWAHAADVSAVRTGRAKGCCSKYAFEKAEKAWRSLPLSNLPRAPAAAGTCPLHAQAVTGTFTRSFQICARSCVGSRVRHVRCEDSPHLDVEYSQATDLLSFLVCSSASAGSTTLRIHASVDRRHHAFPPGAPAQLSHRRIRLMNFGADFLYASLVGLPYGYRHDVCPTRWYVASFT